MGNQGLETWMTSPKSYGESVVKAGFIYMCVLVSQSCPTLCDPMDCNLPGSSVHEIFQARILERVAISFSIYIVRFSKNINLRMLYRIIYALVVWKQLYFLFTENFLTLLCLLSNFQIFNPLFCCLVANHVRLFCNPIDDSPSGSSVHAIFQARILE